ncbi:hypothetical protein ACQKLP_02795 [Chitinophaga sp. NPDC101104]|uniref:hypothetical protein n=1 Tax=Chitinophaga sp. NPDC101104 TaxID=3390561 RepID=UPI003D07F3D8
MKTSTRLIIELTMPFIVMACYCLSCWMDGDKFYLVRCFSWSMILVIYAHFRLQRQVILFSPVNMFCLVYLTVPLTNFYYIATDFESALFMERISMYHDYVYLFEMASFYYLAGLLSLLAGYAIIAQPPVKPLQFSSERTINSYVLLIVAAGLLGLGILNFVYNVFSLAGGNIISYMSNVALRKEEFQEGGTALGYQFYYMGSYLITYHYVRLGRKAGLLLYGVILGGVLLMASSGRIYATLAYLMSFVAIFYYVRYLKTGNTNTRKYVLYLFPLPLIGLAFYFLRIVSGMIAGGTTDDSVVEIMGNFSDLLGFYAIDKGNTPNVAVFMKIIDAWSVDHGYIFGKSLYSGVLNNLPSAIRPDDVNATSFMVRDLWYSNVAKGGALPTTAVGEMYMNFGPLGVFLGMFAVGMLIKLWFSFVIRSRNFWHYVALVIVSLTFIALYPKVDFTNLNPLDVIIAYMPILLVWGLTQFLNTAAGDRSLRGKNIKPEIP